MRFNKVDSLDHIEEQTATAKKKLGALEKRRAALREEVKRLENLRDSISFTAVRIFLSILVCHEDALKMS